MIGRITMGKKKEDNDFFKYCLVKSFLYGQQLGWEKADVIYNEYRMSFLKKIVSLRHEHNSFFHSSYLLRPPAVKSNLSPVITTPAIWYNEDVVMEQVLCGSWRQRNTNRILVFVFNNADTDCEYNLTIPYREYGILRENLPGNEEYKLSGDKLEVSGILSALSYKIYEFNTL